MAFRFPGFQSARIYFGIALVAATFGATSPASAAVVQVIYAGIIDSSHDNNGDVGVAGPNTLVGDSFKASYVFDTSVGSIFTGAKLNSTSGGTAIGQPSPLISASITLNGQVLKIGGGYASELYGDTLDHPGEQFASALEYGSAANNNTETSSYESILSVSPAFSSTITGPFFYDVGPNDTTYAFAQVISNGSSHNIYVDVTAHLTSLSISPVPLPASGWMFASLLFGLTGAAVRRRGPRI